MQTLEEKRIIHRLSQKKYKLSKKGRITEKKYYKSEASHKAHAKWRAKNQEKIIAHKMVNIALKAGVIFRGKCERCGKSNAFGHHDDYNKPLELRWFCNRHHLEYHRIIKDWR